MDFYCDISMHACINHVLINFAFSTIVFLWVWHSHFFSTPLQTHQRWTLQSMQPNHSPDTAVCLQITGYFRRHGKTATCSMQSSLRISSQVPCRLHTDACTITQNSTVDNLCTSSCTKTRGLYILQIKGRKGACAVQFRRYFPHSFWSCWPKQMWTRGIRHYQH